MNATHADLVVTGIGVVSVWGDDPARLDLRTSGTPAAADDGWFDTAAELPGRGFRHAPSSCRYLLAATRRAVKDAGAAAFAAVPEERRGMAVGTNNGNTALLEAMNETVTTSGADRLSPASAPFFSINTIAGRVAMEQGVKGWNLTLTTPMTAGLETVLAGTRAAVAGRCDVLLAGATEASVPGLAESDCEAGAAVLVMEPRQAALARRCRPLRHLPGGQLLPHRGRARRQADGRRRPGAAAR
jgi:3-oxoacyl-[acyl-carrier-protein] synthase II